MSLELIPLHGILKRFSHMMLQGLFNNAKIFSIYPKRKTFLLILEDWWKKFGRLHQRHAYRYLIPIKKN